MVKFHVQYTDIITGNLGTTEIVCDGSFDELEKKFHIKLKGCEMNIVDINYESFKKKCQLKRDEFFVFPIIKSIITKNYYCG